MKVPISWLKSYVDFEDTVQGLADRLTFSGIEVEGIETVGGALEGIVVGEVRAVNRHPNADRLTVCRVFDGVTEAQVVCGAPNVSVGAKIPFAPIGVTLPGGMKMKRAKIRGEESFGMLCAEDELGLSKDHSGVMILDDQWAPGTPLNEILGPADTILDLEITPNRPDCLSLLGIAREVAVLYGAKLKRPTTSLEEKAPSVDTFARVEVEDASACPRYTARVLTQVRIAPSPEWMQQYLTKAGIRPINNIVDITNFVMLETGHPLHAFDLSQLEEGQIIVRRARPDEKITTLDGVDRALSPDMLVIAGTDQPLAIAGIMGGSGSEISETTTTVLLEAACFDPLLIRTMSRSLALSTESSHRFERGVDPNTVDGASQRAAALMVQYAGAQLAIGAVDLYPCPLKPWPVKARWDFIRDLTGMTVNNDRIRQLLTALELKFIDANEQDFTVLVPTFRADLEREVDLVEEVARLHGLDHVPSLSPHARLIPGAEDHQDRAAAELKSNAAGLGFREVMNYSLTAPALLNLFDPSDAATRIGLPNPISVDQSVLRPSLIPQLVETMGRNYARQIREASFFECGRTYRRTEQEIQEHERMALGLMGPVGRASMDGRPVQEPEIFAWIKGAVEALLAAQGIAESSMRAEDHPYFEPGQAVAIYIGTEKVGCMGIIRAAIRREWRFAEPIAVAELLSVPLIQHYREPGTVNAPPVYPSVDRDVALVAPHSLTHEEIVNVIRQAAPPELDKVALFDIFEGEAIGAGNKSMAYRLTYRSAERTLTDAEANGYHETVKEAMRRLLQVSVRES